MLNRTAVVAISTFALLGVLYGDPAVPSTGAATTTPAAITRITNGLVDVNVVLAYENVSGAGTGMVLNADGEVLTNNHVVRDATSLSVVDVANHRTYRATVVGYDVDADVAVLHLSGASRLTRVLVGNSASVRVGDSVTAIGNAGGTGGTPSQTKGTVTALNQAITAVDELGGSEQLTGLIETNAALQPGDSGGPLVSAAGKVIGIDTAGSTGFSFSSSTSAGFAIPINKALHIAREIATGTSSAAIHIGPTAFLGVEVEQMNYFTGSSFAEELVVTGVISGSPAATTDLVPGDVITSFDGTAVSSPSSLTDLLIAATPGEVVPLVWQSQFGSSQSADVTLATGPAQ